MKFLVEVERQFGKITLLTEDHSEAMKLYNENKNEGKVSFRKLDEKQEAEYLNDINHELFLSFPSDE